MTIVIPYCKEVRNGIELRYALRSIEKYLSGWDEIILVGEKPDWYNGKFIYAIDQPAMKNYNIYSKILLACNSGLISDDFIMWHDDHYLLQPLDVSQIKYWHNGSLQDELNRNLGGRYRKAVENTLMYAPNAMNYDIHVPIVFNKNKFSLFFKDLTNELCIKSLYTETAAKYDCWSLMPNSEKMDDCKIPFQIAYDRLKEKIDGRIFFSIQSAAIGNDLIRLWDELYPNKSNYEL